MAHARRIAIVTLGELYGNHGVMDLFNFSYARLKAVFSKYDLDAMTGDNLLVRRMKHTIKRELTALNKSKAA